MLYLSTEEIVAIHDRVVQETGGSLGVRDKHLLTSLAERPKSSFGGEEQYESVFEKAASLLEALIRYHVFVDGNKRTGLTVAAIFLNMNGYKIKIGIQAGLVFIDKVAVENLEVNEIALWLKKNSQKQ